MIKSNTKNNINIKASTQVMQVAKFNALLASLFVMAVGCLSVANAADTSMSAAKTSAQSHAPHAMYFAKVNGQEISLKEFQSAFKAGAGKRFYHGKIPEAELLAFKKEVSQTLVDRVLLLEEARRLKITADQKFVDDQLSAYDKRYADKPFWLNNKANIIPGLKAALEEQSILAKFESKVRNVELPALAQVKSYYENNQALFTTPEKLRVSLILLKVEPSSPAVVWDAARKEAEELIERVKNGGDFSQLARIHSGDASASKGGDMGFIHKGMLAKPAQVAIDEMNAGQISQPIMLLRGVAVIRLEEKQNASLNAFENLRSAADITINNVALGIDSKV